MIFVKVAGRLKEVNEFGYLSNGRSTIYFLRLTT